MARLLVACALLVTGVLASPHGDSVPFDPRYSTDINEDARLDAPDLIRKYGYPVEVHEVVTPDGYILQMHRIPHGRDRNSQPGPKPVVFLQHGLLCSSADWINMGPNDKGLGYILAEEGFDVWMGNARGNYYSRRHLRLRPDALLNTDFWDFSWHEIGYIDLPTMIDYSLAKSGAQKLHYIGHSQGTTSFFVMASKRPVYNAKIISMHALAPVAFMSRVSSPLLQFISPYARQIETLTSLIGMGEFLPNSNIMTWAGQQMCEDEATFQIMCTSILFLVAGRNEDQLNATMLPVKLGHTPAGASTKQLAHYGQGIESGDFREYDYGRVLNLLRYGSFRPPKYPLNRVTAPVFLHYSDADPLADPRDVAQLNRELGSPIGMFRIQQATFSHLDFLWAIDAKTLVYNRVINLLWAMNNN